MRALTILAALILAAIGGAYGALVASGGGTAVSEPFVVVPVRPPPARGAAPQAAPTVSSQSPVAGVPNANLPAASTGSPAVAGMAATEQPARTAPPAAAGPSSAVETPTNAGANAGPRLPPARAPGGVAPAGLGARPSGG